LKVFPVRCHSRLCGNGPGAAGPGGSSPLAGAGRTATQPARRRGALLWKGGSCNRSHLHRSHLIQPGLPEPGRCGAPPGPCTAVLPCGAPPGRRLARTLSDGGGVAFIEATRFSPAFRSRHAQAGALRRARSSKCSAFLRPPGIGAVLCGPHPRAVPACDPQDSERPAAALTLDCNGGGAPPPGPGHARPCARK
jgi:hypothetical protein